MDFREAYFYAIEEAYARDVPRATSEYFLELWQPWYIRWLPSDLSNINNEYMQLATHLAAKLGMPYSPAQHGFVEAVDAGRARAESAYRDIDKTMAQLKKYEREIRRKLKTQINMQWPAATNVYAESYLVFIERDLAELNQWLLAQPDYSDLAEQQEKIEQLEDALLKAERDVGMHMRLQRALHLAKLRHAIGRFGSEKALRKYSELLQCEEWDGLIKKSH
ncbi:MAG: hypothetical protein RQ936_05020 [Gammaproteobacteria bacterium]|nr:hypothetical protein [Gammaproteobacteria bacterium]